MQHVMNKEEIQEAIVDFLNKNGLNTEGKHVGVTLAPGGASATIEVSAEPIKQKRAPRKPAAAKPAQEKVIEEVAEEVVAEETPADTPEESTETAEGDDNTTSEESTTDDDNLFGTED